ncbi:hypothetical protein PAXRUDRAFT_154881, partial [Paxillus rubicundulus Ve08.2h10]
WSMELQRLALARTRDWLGMKIRSFVSGASSFMGQTEAQGPEKADQDQEDWIDEILSEDDAEVAFGNLDPHHAKESHLPFPSSLGRNTCEDLGMDWRAEEELELRKGQANDCLHYLRMALAEKSILFLTELWHASSQTQTTWAWEKINAIELMVKKHAAVYRACQTPMISLRADEDTLVWYWALEKDHLKVSTAVSDPNIEKIVGCL